MDHLSVEMLADEMHLGDCSNDGGASPLTARHLRLERVAQALAHSQEELRRYTSLYSDIYKSDVFCVAY